MIVGKDEVLPIVTWDTAPNWDDVRVLCAGWLTEDGVKRLSQALGGRIKTVAVERHYIDRDYRDTFSNYHSKRFSTPPSRCIRLLFFSEVLSRDNLRYADKVQTSFLGYSVVRPTQPNCIGRTMILSRGPHLRGAHLCTCKEKISLQGTDLTVRGFPFISQDTDVTVCAQSALWMILRYFSDRYSAYSEMHPYEIGNLTRDYSIGRLFPTGGLYTWQLAEALRKARFSPLIYDRDHVKTDFDDLLYTYIESGIPLLVTVPGHVVAGIGHKSDFARDLPPGNGWISSSHFNNAIIIHNDNKFPAEILPRDSLSGAGISKYSFPDIDTFVVPLPEKVFLPAEDFQHAALAVLTKGLYAYTTKSTILNTKRLVLRFLLTTVSSFKRRLVARGMGNPDAESIYRNLPLPHFIWVCEISDVETYIKHKKVWGEIIWDATRNVYESDGWIALHYPEMLLVDEGSAFNGPQKHRTFNLKDSNEYPLYISNLEEVP